MSGPTARLRRLLRGLPGSGVVLTAPADEVLLRATLTEHGFAVVDVFLPPGSGLRQSQALVAQALRLPTSAEANLDAMTDSLRDLRTWWPDNERIAVLIHDAESLVRSDLAGWQLLTELLADAAAGLRRGREGDRVLEVVALVEGHGVVELGHHSFADQDQW